MFVGKFKDSIPNINAFDIKMFSIKNYKILFEGKIYNKKDLGFSFEISEPEVIASLYENKGITSFAEIDGSFTFIIIDREETLIVRDHHGTGSQVYYNDKFFASSLALLQKTPEFNNKPNLNALSSFLSIGYISTPNSSFVGVNKLGAGYCLKYSSGKIETHNLFNTSSTTPNFEQRDIDTLSQQYGELHTKAIRKRIDGCNNVGILLSGGYDSGCNLAALRKNYNGDIHSFSIGFKGDNWSELPLAKCMSNTFDTIHNQYEIDGSEITALPKIIADLGDPFVEGGLMVNYAAMRMIGCNKPDIILGGDGNDQYFGTSGREVAIHHLASKYGIKPVLTTINNILSNKRYDKNNTLYRIHFHLNKILNILQGDLFGIEPSLQREILQDKNIISNLENIKTDNRSFEHIYTQHAYKSDLEKIINQVILFKASRMADMFDNKIAFPYMDIELYNFLMSVPVKYKCSGNSPLEIARGRGDAKFLLKYHYKSMLPEEITQRKKQGGFAPMPIFFKDKAQRDRIADFIMSSTATQDFFSKDGLERFITTYDREADNSNNWFWYKQNKAIQYFNILTIAIWWEQYVKGRSEIVL